VVGRGGYPAPTRRARSRSGCHAVLKRDKRTGGGLQARLDQLAKRAEHQARQAAIAQDLPESKRWIDSALIERNFQ